MQLQLSDVKPRRFEPPYRWTSSWEGKVELNWRETFFKEHFKDVKHAESPLTVSSIPEDADAYHRGYVMYLEKCWSDHVGIVVKPDIIWHLLMCEVASLTKSAPDRYRHLFSETEEKQQLIVVAEGFVMPLDQLTDLLKQLTPTDSGLFLPEFTTTTDRSRHAILSAFCDVCSPYYDYSMACCGFPAIDVRGTQTDWEKMETCWLELTLALEEPREWLENVYRTLQTCCERLGDEQWWRDMFSLEKCGSGSDVEAGGWLTRLFREQPEMRYPRNFPPCVSSVEYRHLNLAKDFQMQDGLFFSRYDGDFAEPDFGYTVCETSEK